MADEWRIAARETVSGGGRPEEFSGRIDDADGVPVCKVVGSNAADVEGKLLLIAAAPKLLAALGPLVEALEAGEWDEAYLDMLRERGRAAIAKAEE